MAPSMGLDLSGKQYAHVPYEEKERLLDPDEAGRNCVLPDRESWAGCAPGFHRLPIRTWPLGNPLEELAGEGVGRVGHT